MSQQYDNRNRGFLMKNERQRAGSKDPAYTGIIDIDGREYRLSAWVRESQKSGKKFLSLAVTPAEARAQAAHAHAQGAAFASGDDDNGHDHDIDAAMPSDHEAPAAPPTADLMIHDSVIGNIIRAARKVWPAERWPGPGFNSLLAKFGVTDVENLTPSQGEQVMAYLTEQWRAEGGS